MSLDVNGDDPLSSLRNLAMTAAVEEVFQSFGAPNGDVVETVLSKDPSLVALHLAATFYKIAIVLEVLQHYAFRAKLTIDEFPVLSLLINALKGERPRSQARALYANAAKLAPDLSEAHYGLARLDQAESNLESALGGFEKVLSLPPHAETPPHAFLHANARWERATILEGQGRDKEALLSYRAAIAELGIFGVHHIRFARFLRRLGRFDEAAAHYRYCMSYTHRYFPEFILPPLTTPEILVTQPIDVIYNTQRGEPVIFWNGTYLALDGREWSPDLTNPRRLDRRLASGLSHRKASSIAALEDAIG